MSAAEPVHDLPAAIDRALAGTSVLVLPRTREGSIAEVDPAGYDGDRPPALILFTSGSTGAPKGVALSARALSTSAHATERFLSGPGDWYSCLPINHIAGFQVELRARLAGREPVRSASATFTAALFAEDVDRLLHRAKGRPGYTSLVPTQLHRVLADPRATAAAAELEAILLGGAAISPALLEQSEASGLRIVRTYGMSETAGGCVYNGRPFDGVDITITEAGTIDLSGDVVADSYVAFDGTGRIRPVPSSALSCDAEGRRTIHTSDLGRLDNGVLSVLGRTDDVIVSGGTNVSPHALETGLLPCWQKHGIAEVLVTWVPDAEWGKRIVVLVRPDANGIDPALPKDPTGLAHHLRGLDHGMQGHLLPRQAIVVSEIPSRSIGKPDRRAAAGLAAEILAAEDEESGPESGNNRLS